ncbi:DUF192 domain-containing protein [Spirochaeta isovalerica]|uniref:DUF192 domain-containing protein n=1 Tax=Spirochaeta isovalerica TaxID=150 RepID=A0A841R9M8_9SPIO|nr:DUF192 domain-containing protein [Spirochaeta isovalerica]MBB6479162.1 hypothetical protein [Spirochaeta isovalerica]
MKKNLLLTILAVLAFLSCDSSSLETAEIQVGDKTIRVEIADNDQSRATGLMNRKSMDEDHGMLFVFQEEKKMSFWMKNTLIPLSIAYISKNGEIKEIYDMYPLDESPVRSTRSVLYALEMNQGWFERNGISPGDRITLPENR